MKPLIVLLLSFLIALLTLRISRGNYDPALAGRIAMCVMLIFTAVAHFTFTKGMAMMLPEFVPFKKSLVYVTGIFEIFLGIGLLVCRPGTHVAWMLIILMLLMLPANISAAFNRIDYQKASPEGPGVAYLWFRVPLQIFFLVWIYMSSIYC